MRTWWRQIRDELAAEGVEVDGRLQVTQQRKRGPAKQFIKCQFRSQTIRPFIQEK